MILKVGVVKTVGGVFRPKLSVLHSEDSRPELHEPLGFKLKEQQEKREASRPENPNANRMFLR